MNTYEFIASIISSVTWPATLVFIIYMLRDKISGMLPYVEKMQYRDFSVEFKKSLEEIAEESSELTEEVEEELGSKELQEHLYQLAEIAPRSAVLESWLNVEAWAKNRLYHLGLSTEELAALPPYKIGELLEEKKVLSPQNIEAFHKLRNLRNKAVHVTDFEFPSDVSEYVVLSLALGRFIRMSTHPSHESHAYKQP
jgi:hypothetical protein